MVYCVCVGPFENFRFKISVCYFIFRVEVWLVQGKVQPWARPTKGQPMANQRSNLGFDRNQHFAKKNKQFESFYRRIHLR